MKLKRNADAVREKIVVNAAKQLICKEACSIHLPVRFTSRKLGQIGTLTFAYACFPLILDGTGEYGVFNTNALIELNPFKTTEIEIDGTEYYQFSFQPGQVVFKTIEVVRRENVLFNIFDELIFKGKIPWYVEYEDLASLTILAHKYAGSKIGANPEVMELLASIVTRDATDRSKYIRHVAVDYAGVDSKKTAYVPLMSVYWSVNSTVNKLAGAYFSDGVISAIVKPTDRVEKMESILRA